MWLTVLVSLSLFKTIKPYVWACSSVWLERTPDKGEVGSSSLPRPTMTVVSLGAVAQLGEHLLCKQGGTGSIPVSSTKVLSFSIYIVK